MAVASIFDLAYFGPGLFARSVASTLFHWMGMLDPGLSEASRTRQGRGALAAEGGKVLSVNACLGFHVLMCGAT